MLIVAGTRSGVARRARRAYRRSSRGLTMSSVSIDEKHMSAESAVDMRAATTAAMSIETTASPPRPSAITRWLTRPKT